MLDGDLLTSGEIGCESNLSTILQGNFTLSFIVLILIVN